MISKTSLLYIGSLDRRSNSFRRFEALANLVHHIQGLNSDPFIMLRFISGIQHYYNVGVGILLFNKKIRKEVTHRKYSYVWVDNKTYLSKKTLKYIKRVSPATKIINLLTDDPFGRYKDSWRMITDTASLYDHIFVQREINKDELASLGSKHVGICYRSYAPDYNRPLKLSPEDRAKYHSPVGFVGTYEKARAESVAYLIQQGIPVTVTGDHWPDKDYWEFIQPFYKGPSVYGEEYIKTVNGMEIALHFLRQANRDVQDSRTFEIPASKVFMLAEYSDVHASLFQDGKEAVFFTTKEELLEKVQYFLQHPEERDQIAKAGYQRCISSGYDHYHTMQRVLEIVQKENNA